MNPEQVFQKTEKGREEIAKRTHRLDARKRMALIVVDAQSSAEELAAKVASSGDGLAMLQALWDDGFIEPVGGAAPAPAATATASSPPAGAGRAATAPAQELQALPFEQLRRAGCKAIERLMGPDGDNLALKLERTTSREEFYAEARKTRDALAAFLGPKKAEAFARAIGL